MKYRANVGGGIVEAQKIKDYRFDAKAQQHYLILGDDTRRPQPVLHGMKPMIGDWYVETSTGTTRLRDGSQYEERSAAAIIKAVDFDITYSPVPEDRSAAHRVLEAPYKLSDVPQPEDPYTVFVMPDQAASMREIINADDIVTEESGATLTPEMLALGAELLEADAQKEKIPAVPLRVKEQLTEWANDVIAQDIAAQEISDNEIREAEDQAELDAQLAQQAEARSHIEMVDNQTADGE